MNGQPERFLRADAVARAFRARDVRVSTRARRRTMESGREKSIGRDEHRARVKVTSRARESSDNQSINHRVPFVPSQHLRYFHFYSEARVRVRVRRWRWAAREVNEGEKK